MSKPRWPWWPYAKDMIRRYPALRAELGEIHSQPVTPCYSGVVGGGGARRATEDVAIRELPTNKQREYEAVRRAIAVTERMTAGRDRLTVIDLVFWRRSHTLSGAALTIPCHYKTAQGWHKEFILLVGWFYGFLDGEEIPLHKSQKTVLL